MQNTPLDIAIIGAGAAGLMAAIQAANNTPDLKIGLIDGAKKPGAKILVAGGGRCNVTHKSVSQYDFAGGSANSIKKILGRFNVTQTCEFFSQRGVELKTEANGKIFPKSDTAGDILNALNTSCHRAGIALYKQHRVTKVTKPNDDFIIECDNGVSFKAKCIIMATGGKSLPKTGSDGYGYSLCEHFGHQMTEHIFPSLVPLLLPTDHFLCQLSGCSLKAKMYLQQRNGKSIVEFTDSLLFTHFGLSGPAALDISRYYLDAKIKKVDAELRLNMLPDIAQDDLLKILTRAQEKRQVSTILQSYLPTRLVSILLQICDIEVTTRCAELSRVKRNNLLDIIYASSLPIQGDRGFTYAEVTAGGVPLDQVSLKTLESRFCAGLYLCGEILDVDGRIGGFNFQWAWASGYTAGISAALACSK